MDRVATARERLTALRRELAASDLFCMDCQYLRGENCHHPAVSAYSMDLVNGNVEWIPPTARKARSEEGACGPEAALFEPPEQPSVAAAWGGIKNAVAVLVGAVIVAGIAAQLLF